ncbi:SDR family oxidoreductase [Nocardia goodfellowii]|uniref:NAD(P)-dependent dehydrogenase (Short-subunit alcohol dehydrogenase family) n=1 Tax=Nocardia goodfellowii TaxID=882446 RepID=A0ABS4QII2_9NOCA|nr:SDR family NAD(P)-dependent oxidoreductase [Nocardia goodfellowii]MBP2191522.1 NAD(P)-dependent dehydrogenase (short-subunit alcohol dehydrogenase family) [Nocardia goodfellowii]
MELAAGQVAVVTGAANGIGAALAAALVARGLRVVLADIDTGSLQRIADELGERALAVPTDVADIDQVRALAARTLREFGRVDLVVNNAGMSAGGPTWEVDPGAWNRVWAVNVGGVVNGVHVFAPHLIAAGRGHIVNVASLAALTVGMFGAPYAASKAAIISISESLRGELELIAPGVGVTVICPGPVDTQMFRGLAQLAEPAQGTPDSNVLPPELAAKLAPMLAAISEMVKEALPPARAAEIIVAAVESGTLYATTHPAMAQAARDRSEAILDSFGTPR